MVIQICKIISILVAVHTLNINFALADDLVKGHSDVAPSSEKCLRAENLSQEAAPGGAIVHIGYISKESAVCLANLQSEDDIAVVESLLRQQVTLKPHPEFQ